MQLVSSALMYGQTGTRVSTDMDSQNPQQQSALDSGGEGLELTNDVQTVTYG